MELKKTTIILLILLIPFLAFAAKDIWTNSNYNLYNLTNISVLRAVEIYQSGNALLDASNVPLFNVNHSNTTSSMAWTGLHTYPAGCSSGLWVNDLNDSVTCAAPTAADVDPGTFPSGAYAFSNNLAVLTGNISQNDNYYSCYGDACDGYIYFNGTDLVIKVN